jgi:hypothetical protein
MKKLNTVLLCLGLGFLTYLVWEVGPDQLWHEVSALGWGVIFLILVEGVANLAHTVAWRHCINKTHPSVPLLRLFRTPSFFLVLHQSTIADLTAASLFWPVDSMNGRNPDEAKHRIVETSPT